VPVGGATVDESEAGVRETSGAHLLTSICFRCCRGWRRRVGSKSDGQGMMTIKM
jgi:hypothetical protein